MTAAAQRVHASDLCEELRLDLVFFSVFNKHELRVKSCSGIGNSAIFFLFVDDGR